jgi:guanine deaminase
MHERFLREAILLAEAKISCQEGGPFAALVVRDNEIIGRGWNQVVASLDPTAHAEIVAIRDACRNSGSFHLPGAVLYVNCEPCPMCLAAAYWAGITTVCYGATRADAAAIGFADDHIHRELRLPHGQKEMRMVQALRAQALVAFSRWQALEDRVLY